MAEEPSFPDLSFLSAWLMTRKLRKVLAPGKGPLGLGRLEVVCRGHGG